MGLAVRSHHRMGVLCPPGDSFPTRFRPAGRIHRVHHWRGADVLHSSVLWHPRQGLSRCRRSICIRLCRPWHKAAFICGWGLVLSYTCVIAANGTAVALLSRFLLPGVFDVGYLYSIAGWDVYLGELLLLSALFVFFAYMNYKGMSCASGIQLIFSLALAAGVAVLAFGSFSTETARFDNLYPLFAEDRAAWISVLAVIALGPFLFQGFDTIPQTAEEFNFPPSLSTKLMLYSIVCGGILYILVLLAVASILPYPAMLAQNHPWLTGEVATLSFGKIGGAILAIPVLAGIFSGMNGYFIASTRLLFSMGRGKFIPSWIRKGASTPRNPCQRYSVRSDVHPHRSLVRPGGPELAL